MGIARALLVFNIELRKKLKGEGFLARDARGKGRKKYGQKGAASASSSRSGNALGTAFLSPGSSSSCSWWSGEAHVTVPRQG